MLNTGLLDGVRPLGIALSGGSDSTALLLLAAESLGAAQLRAVTVDHGLRREAAEEARQAARLCAFLGVSHDTLTLSLAKGSDLQARARAARYAALSDWSRQSGTATIALGHTCDDLAETFLIRLARGSGVDGLAAMPERFERAGCTYLRPLLAARRAELQSLLRSRGVTWSEDPSNADPEFTRVQMREARPALSRLGLTPDRLAQTAHWMRAASDVLEDAAEHFIAAHAQAEHGDALLARSALRDAREETALRVLARALCGVSQNPYRPRLSALRPLLHVERAATLHGCLIYPHNGHLRITRELSAANLDNSRWRIVGPIAPDQHIAPLRQDGLKQIPDWRSTALLPRRSLLATPAVWHGDRLIAAPIAQPDDQWRATAPNPLHLSK